MGRVGFLECLLLAAACTPHDPPPVTAKPIVLPDTPVAPEPAAASAEPVPEQPRARFEVVLIDDAKDHIVVSPDSELPEGVTIFQERIAVLQNAVQLGPRPNESLDQALARIQPWLSGIALPPDARLGWQLIYSSHPATDEPVFEGWRGFVLRGAPVLTTADIVKVTHPPNAGYGEMLMIELSPAATERFRLATRAHLRQRMAIMLDGLVETSPIIMSEISGGKVQLSLGQDQDAAAAEQLVARLRPR